METFTDSNTSSPAQEISRLEKEKRAVELSQYLHRTIVREIKKYGGRIIRNPSEYSIVQIFPEVMNPENDILSMSGKAQILYNNKNYYIPLGKKYYKMEQKLGIRTNVIRQGILKKIMSRLMNPSPKNRRGKAKEAVALVVKKVGGSLSMKSSSKSTK